MGGGGCSAIVTPIAADTVEEDVTFTSEEVAKHNTPEDAWIIVSNSVYDISGWKSHPGGSVIFKFAGRDGTDYFNAFHGTRAQRVLKNFKIGKFAREKDSLASDGPSGIVKDFRALNVKYRRMGLFKSSKLYYVYKILTNMTLLSGACGLMLSGLAQQSVFGYLLSSFLLALFWQQMGWLAHDFLHNQVFENRHYNVAMGYIFGNVMQGFCVDWWKTKHNTHHAFPNEIPEDSTTPSDPDIDTVPYLSWSKEQAKEAPRFLLKFQAYFLFPLLAVARMNWCKESMSHALGFADGKLRIGEAFFLSLHYIWVASLALSGMGTWSAAIGFCLLSEVMSGLMLSFVFIQNHNSMEIYNTPKDFYTSQIISTRDVRFSAFHDWFTGGLNVQIEHHLFPTMPRHNLWKIAKEVQGICEKHGLTYERLGFRRSTIKILSHLAEISLSVN